MNFTPELLQKINLVIVSELSTKTRVPAKIIFHKLMEENFLELDTKESIFCAQLGQEIKNGKFPGIETKRGKTGGIRYKTASIKEIDESEENDELTETKIVEVKTELVSQETSHQEDGYVAVNEIALKEITSVERFDSQKELARDYFSSKKNRISGKYTLPKTNVLIINGLPWTYHVSPWFIYNYIANILGLKEDINGNIKLDNLTFCCKFKDEVNVITEEKLKSLIKFLVYQVEAYVPNYVVDLYLKDENKKGFVAATDKVLVDEYAYQCFQLIDIEKNIVTESDFLNKYQPPKHIVQLTSYLKDENGNS